jgi:hypothetical protein
MADARDQMNGAISLFYSYSHEDEALRDELEKHLALAKRQGYIAGWHDRRIGAGEGWNGELDKNLEEAQVILLLISPSFLASDYCYDIETKRALERHDRGDARVIPVLLRPVDWEGAPFARLQGLPTDLRPVTTWENRDEAMRNIAQGIRRVVEEMIKTNVATQLFAGKEQGPSHPLPSGPAATVCPENAFFEHVSVPQPPTRRSDTTLSDLADEECLALAGQLKEHGAAIGAMSRPPVVRAEVAGGGTSARISVPSLKLPGVLTSIFGALELIPIHQGRIAHLEKLKANPIHFFYADSFQVEIDERTAKIADETCKVRRTLEVLVSEVWREGR